MIYAAGSVGKQSAGTYAYQPKTILSRNAAGQTNLYPWLRQLREQKKAIWGEGEIHLRLDPDAIAGPRLVSDKVRRLSERIATLDPDAQAELLMKYEDRLDDAQKEDRQLERQCFYALYNKFISDASRAHLEEFYEAELREVMDADNVQALLLLLIRSHGSQTSSKISAARDAEDVLNNFRMSTAMTIGQYNRKHLYHLNTYAAAELLINPDFRLEDYKKSPKVKQRYAEGMTTEMTDWNILLYTGKLDDADHPIEDLYKSSEDWHVGKVNEAIRLTGSPKILQTYNTPIKARRANRDFDSESAYFSSGEAEHDFEVSYGSTESTKTGKKSGGKRDSKPRGRVAERQKHDHKSRSRSASTNRSRASSKDSRSSRKSTGSSKSVGFKKQLVQKHCSICAELRKTNKKVRDNNHNTDECRRIKDLEKSDSGSKGGKSKDKRKKGERAYVAKETPVKTDYEQFSSLFRDFGSDSECDEHCYMCSEVEFNPDVNVSDWGSQAESDTVATQTSSDALLELVTDVSDRATAVPSTEPRVTQSETFATDQNVSSDPTSLELWYEFLDTLDELEEPGLLFSDPPAVMDYCSVLFGNARVKLETALVKTVSFGKQSIYAGRRLLVGEVQYLYQATPKDWIFVDAVTHSRLRISFNVEEITPSDASQAVYLVDEFYYLRNGCSSRVIVNHSDFPAPSMNVFSPRGDIYSPSRSVFLNWENGVRTKLVVDLHLPTVIDRQCDCLPDDMMRCALEMNFLHGVDRGYTRKAPEDTVRLQAFLAVGMLNTSAETLWGQEFERQHRAFFLLSEAELLGRQTLNRSARRTYTLNEGLCPIGCYHFCAQLNRTLMNSVHRGLSRVLQRAFMISDSDQADSAPGASETEQALNQLVGQRGDLGRNQHDADSDQAHSPPDVSETEQALEQLVGGTIRLGRKAPDAKDSQDSNDSPSVRVIEADQVHAAPDVRETQQPLQLSVGESVRSELDDPDVTETQDPNESAIVQATARNLQTVIAITESETSEEKSEREAQEKHTREKRASVEREAIAHPPVEYESAGPRIVRAGSEVRNKPVRHAAAKPVEYEKPTPMIDYVQRYAQATGAKPSRTEQRNLEQPAHWAEERTLDVISHRKCDVCCFERVPMSANTCPSCERRMPSLRKAGTSHGSGCAEYAEQRDNFEEIRQRQEADDLVEVAARARPSGRWKRVVPLSLIEERNDPEQRENWEARARAALRISKERRASREQPPYSAAEEREFLLTYDGGYWKLDSDDSDNEDEPQPARKPALDETSAKAPAKSESNKKSTSTRKAVPKATPKAASKPAAKSEKMEPSHTTAQKTLDRLTILGSVKQSLAHIESLLDDHESVLTAVQISALHTSLRSLRRYVDDTNSFLLNNQGRYSSELNATELNQERRKRGAYKTPEPPEKKAQSQSASDRAPRLVDDDEDDDDDGDEDSDGEEDDDEVQFIAGKRPPKKPPPPDPPDSLCDGTPLYVYMVGEDGKGAWKQVIFDSGASAHLFCMQMLKFFDNKRRLIPPKKFEGLGGAATEATWMAGNRHLQDVHFAEGVTQNICSMAMLEDAGFEILVKDGLVTCTSSFSVLLFKRRGGLYYLISAKEVNESAYSATVINPELYRKEQIRRCLKYREEHLLTGCPGRKHELEQMKRGGLLHHAEYTTADILLSDVMLTPCPVCAKAKAIKRKRMFRRPLTTVIGHTQHGDYIYLRGVGGKLVPFLNFVDEASHKLVTTCPKTKEEKFFKECLDTCNDVYLRNKKSAVEQVEFDNEPGVVAFSKKCTTVKFNFCAPGEHVVLVERFNGIHREIISVLLNGCDYKFPPCSFTHLALESADLCNERGRTILDGLPPCEVVDGYKQDMSLLGVRYGAYGLAVYPKGSLEGGDSEKGEIGIVVRRRRGASRLYKVLVLDRTLKAQKPRYLDVTCFKSLPITAEAITKINSLSDIEGTVEEYASLVLGGEDVVEADKNSTIGEVRRQQDASQGSTEDFVEDIQADNLSATSATEPLETASDASLGSLLDHFESEAQVSEETELPPIHKKGRRKKHKVSVNKEDVRKSTRLQAKEKSSAPETTAEVNTAPSPAKLTAKSLSKQPSLLPRKSGRNRRTTDMRSDNTDFVFLSVDKVSEEKYSDIKAGIQAQQRIESAVKTLGELPQAKHDPLRMGFRNRKQLESARKSIDPKELLTGELKDVMEFVYAVNQKLTNMSINKSMKKDKKRTVLSFRAEMRNMIDKDIFTPRMWHELTPKQKNDLIISFTFMKEKKDVDGNLEKLKARLVAGGHMVKAEELGNISSPTVKTESVLLLFALAARKRWKAAVSDVTAAFLNTRLPDDQKIPMRLGKAEADILILEKPEWKPFQRKDGSMIVMLEGGIYGLPQASKLWYEHLRARLIKLGYTPCDMDPAVFIKFNSSGKISVVSVHVDDLLHFYEFDQAQKDLISDLESAYGPMTTKLGDEGIYVGIEYKFDRRNGSVKLSMKKYITSLVESYKITKVEKTPCAEDLMENELKTGQAAPAPVDAKTFASVVMALYYAAIRVRPDILMTVNYLSTRSLVATTKDLKSAYRVLKYLNGTREVGIVLKPSGLTPHFYVDASYAIYDDGRSQTGCVFTLGGDVPTLGKDGPITSWTGAQKFITVSSTEAEMSAVFQMHQWYEFYRLFLAQLRMPVTKPIIVLQDNDASILNYTEGFRQRTKPLNMRYNYIRELVERKLIKLLRVGTKDMMADPLTKPFFSPTMHLPLLRRLNNDFKS